MISGRLDASPTDTQGLRATSTSYTPVGPVEVLAATSSIALAGPVDAVSESSTEDRPRTVTESVDGKVIGKMYYAYVAGGDGGRVEITERAASPGAAYGAAANQRTKHIYGPRASAGKARTLSRVEYADGRMDVYEYESGSGGEKETVTHTVTSQPAGVPNKSTREVRTTNRLGRLVRDERWVNVAGKFVQASWSDFTYDRDGRLTRTRHSNGTSSTATWGCCGYDTQVDEQGITTRYYYDALGRVESEECSGITTTHVYDAAGREVETRRSSSAGTLTSLRSYDALGRVKTSRDEGHLWTSYGYSADGRTTRW